MTDDITTALETARDLFNDYTMGSDLTVQQDRSTFFRALVTIEAELTRLREQAAINEKATRARNLVLEGREDEAKDVWKDARDA